MKKLLFQFDTDPHASVFDTVVAVDSGIDHLFQYAAVTPDNVRDLIHGAMFTRGPQDLHRTAVFVGGSQVAAAEAVLERLQACFFGPLRVSVLFDANGCNTTAVAAVLSAERHVPLAGTTAVVLAGTGPVGQRAARLLARGGARVRIASRNVARAQLVCQQIESVVPGSQLTPFQITTKGELQQALHGAAVVLGCGAAGVELIAADDWSACSAAQVMIDLNAVPPAGIAGIKPADKGVERSGTICYGAMGVGGLKMKIHKGAIAQLFERNDQILDVEEVYALGRAIIPSASTAG
jgi:hypothetical protein